MKQILILESNTSTALEAVANAGRKTASECFVHALAEINADANPIIRRPYVDGEFDAGVLFDVDGVMLTGSAVDWPVDDERALPHQKAVHSILNSGKPIWGSCAGMQMIMWLLGGAIGISPNGAEFGLSKPMNLTPSGRNHPMMLGRNDGFIVPTTHRYDVLSLPEDVQLLASNEHSHVQAVAYETNGVSFWGTQYHPEFTLKHLGDVLGNTDPNSKIVEQLQCAELDQDVCQSLGIVPDDTKPIHRMIEIKNWFDHQFQERVST